MVTVGSSHILAIDESPGIRAIRFKRGSATGRLKLVSESEALFKVMRRVKSTGSHDTPYPEIQIQWR